MNDCLTRIKFGRTLYGRAGVHAAVLEDPWCPTCLKEDSQVEGSLIHSLYECRHTYNIVWSLSKYFFDTTLTRTEFILGVTDSKINQNINKETECLLTSLVNNYALHIIASKIRDRKALVPEIILKEIITQLRTNKLLKPQCTAARALASPHLTHFTNFDRSFFTEL